MEPGAIDGDPTGVVDINDLSIVLENYNQTFGSPAAGWLVCLSRPARYS